MTRRVALVTGANRGIGEAIAEGLGSDGFTVVVGSRVLADGQRVAERIGDGADAVALDVTDEASCRAAVAAVLARHGRCDVLVNNAGGHYDSGVAASAVTPADVRDALEVNLIGPWLLANLVLPSMRANGYGRIVNVSSRSGTYALTWADAPAYGVSKAALNMFTVQLACELRGEPILVNACCPGWVRTRMGGPDAEVEVVDGADTARWLAQLPDDGPSGQMFAERTRIEW